MDGATHSAVGIVTGISLSYLNVKYHFGFGCIGLTLGCYIGSLLPDIDTKSKISYMVGFCLPIKHRTVTHSLMFAMLVGLLGCFLSYGTGIGLCAGILTHLFLDSLTGRGVPLFYPFNKRRYGINGRT